MISGAQMPHKPTIQCAVWSDKPVTKCAALSETQHQFQTVCAGTCDIPMRSQQYALSLASCTTHERIQKHRSRTEVPLNLKMTAATIAKSASSLREKARQPNNGLGHLPGEVATTVTNRSGGWQEARTWPHRGGAATVVSQAGTCSTTFSTLWRPWPVWWVTLAIWMSWRKGSCLARNMQA